MSSYLKSNDVIPALALYESNGNRLEFFIGVHVDSKKLLKRFTFLQKSETNLTLTNKDGVAGIFFLVYSPLKIAQYVFAAVFGS